jgi:hypothetical protein
LELRGDSTKPTNISSVTTFTLAIKPELTLNVAKPQDISSQMDCTYFGRIFCVIVFKDAVTRQNIYWKFLSYQTIWEYQTTVMHVRDLGFNVKSITCDGIRGVFQAFKNLPIQVCNFTRYQSLLDI